MLSLNKFCPILNFNVIKSAKMSNIISNYYHVISIQQILFKAAQCFG